MIWIRTMVPLPLWMTWKVNIYPTMRPSCNSRLLLAEGELHLHELSKLAEKDPEFFKYLQENDQELLQFNPDAPIDAAASDDEEMENAEDVVMEDDRLPVLTKAHLQGWQKALLEVYLVT